MTLADVIANFGGAGVDVSALPQTVLDAGFPAMVGPDGQPLPNPTFSFVASPLGHTTPAGRFYPGGLAIRGTLRLLGVQASAEVTINPLQQLMVDVNFPPLNLGGFMMRGSASQSEQGPRGVVDVQYGSTPKITVTLAGTVNLYGIDTEASFDITPSGIAATGIMAQLPGFGYTAELTMMADHAPLDALQFHVHGVLAADVVSAIDMATEGVVSTASDKASTAVRNAEAYLAKAQADVDRAEGAATAAIEVARQAQAKEGVAAQSVTQALVRTNKDVPFHTHSDIFISSVCHILDSQSRETFTRTALHHWRF